MYLQIQHLMNAYVYASIGHNVQWTQAFREIKLSTIFLIGR